ncbi:LysE family transporter [Vibrio plantisponsor]|jgi:threonine/homoserine/homoserine lactone efflux protein|uniref:LysE family transporter n=1 Tax=Vibrio plantisponsor TaxID=664643 RepID=A0ABU4IFZ6_9VIBR|nr:LysE family transporter [Vibrio plantisponsor]MDW6017482.1 LysE family transporter [Vibrio plantisponsor]NNM42276.1 LysE family transporter [Vibrio plantisponsor]PNH85836.1 transporter [Vibrio diazotrophicus]
MLEILAYAIGVMYTPGPINLLGLHSGLNGKTREHMGFFAGVGCAMLILFVFLGFLGLKFINPSLLPYISLIGCSYIVYIAWKVLHTNVNVSEKTASVSILSFTNGLIMQLLNPKALVATMPISTIQFPAVGISGSSIVIWSIGLAILAFGAPSSYSLAGMAMGKRIENPIYFKTFNVLMFALLIFVATSIGYEHVYRALLESHY